MKHFPRKTASTSSRKGFKNTNKQQRTQNSAVNSDHNIHTWP